MSEQTPEPQPEPQPEPTPPTEPTPEEEAAETGESGEGIETPDEPAQPEPETEPPQPEGLTQKEAEARFQKAEKRFGTYAKGVGELWEEEATYLLPVSISPSAPPGFIDVRDAGRVPEEMKQPIMEFFGLARPVQLKQDPHTRTCPVCDGEGELETGSKVAKNVKHQCRECEGYGFVPPPDRSENGRATADVRLAPVGEHVAPLTDDDRDMWGEAKLLPDGRENPNYGKMPQHKIPVSPWGVTANLTAQDAVAAG